jgi:type II secretory pathway component PulM
MSDTPETQCAPHYYGCACHEKEWQNKWQSALEMAAQAEAKLDALVEHHTRMIIAHAKEVDALKAELASKTPQP